MKNFTSFLSTQTEESIYCRKAAGNWNDSYEENLKRFDAMLPETILTARHCHKIWPTAGVQKGKRK